MIPAVDGPVYFCGWDRCLQKQLSIQVSQGVRHVDSGFAMTSQCHVTEIFVIYYLIGSYH